MEMKAEQKAEQKDQEIQQEGEVSTPDSEGSVERRMVPSRGTGAWESAPADSESERDYTATELSKYREVSVELMVRLPDGRSFRYEEATEVEQGSDWSVEQVLTKVQSVYEAALNRLTR